ncbi:unnamed protein product [marine sediment metagenome]|uniref:Uncharacterized protein n=1 Tax=marine sediment metagenome TaxID=412755 RepID=X0ZCM8_9ZZZZ
MPETQMNKLSKQVEDMLNGFNNTELLVFYHLALKTLARRGISPLPEM